MRLFYFIIGFCLFPPVLVNAKDVRDLTWSPPVLEAPSTYYIRNIGEKIEVRKNDDSIKHYDGTTHVEIHLKKDEDAIIKLPDEVLNLPALRIHFGRNIQIIGGHIKATTPANDKVRGLIWAGGTMGSVYIEGVVLDANFQDGLDALLVGAYGSQSESEYPDIYVQNTVLKNTKNTEGNKLHSDCFQYYGATNKTHMDRVHCATDTQGLFLPAQHSVGEIELRRVSVEYIHPKTANGYALYLRDHGQKRRVPMILNKVYVGQRDTDFGYPHDGRWDVYSVFPHTLMEAGSKRIGDTIHFPLWPEIKGFVRLRQKEYFVQNAGVDYKP